MKDMKSAHSRLAIVSAYVVSACLLSSPLSAEASDQAAALSAIRIANFAEVDDNYYRGAQPEGRDYSDLAALGVKTVIDLTEGGDPNEAGFVKTAGMRFYRIPLTTHVRPSAAAVERFLTLVNDKGNQPVYVHCQGGHHRTGIMTAVYRMTEDGWNADRAYEEMQKYGFGPAFQHATLKAFVFDYYAAHASQVPAESLQAR